MAGIAAISFQGKRKRLWIPLLYLQFVHNLYNFTFVQYFTLSAIISVTISLDHLFLLRANLDFSCFLQVRHRRLCTLNWWIPNSLLLCNYEIISKQRKLRTWNERRNKTISVEHWGNKLYERIGEVLRDKVVLVVVVLVWAIYYYSED